MTAGTTAALRALATVAVVLLPYLAAARLPGPRGRGTRRDCAEAARDTAVAATGVLMVAAVGAVGLCAPDPGRLLRALTGSPADLVLVPAGLLVGVGEFAAACLLAGALADAAPLGRVLAGIADRLGSHGRDPGGASAPVTGRGRAAGAVARTAVSGPASGAVSGAVSTGSNWLLLTRTSWALRARTLRAGLPLPAALALFVAQPLAEEALFRAGLVTALHPIGGWAPWVAAAVAVLLLARLPAARRSAPAAVSGVAVIALVNSLLFLTAPGVLPATAAQLAFFLLASA